MKRTRILLADDHEVLVNLLKTELTRDFDVVGTVANGLALIQKARELDPDVIVTDIAMPRLNGFDALLQLKQEYPDLKFVMLTGFDEQALAQKAVTVGASAFVLKMFLSEELRPAILAAVRGETYITSHLR